MLFNCDVNGQRNCVISNLFYVVNAFVSILRIYIFFLKVYISGYVSLDIRSNN